MRERKEKRDEEGGRRKEGRPQGEAGEEEERTREEGAMGRSKLLRAQALRVDSDVGGGGKGGARGARTRGGGRAGVHAPVKGEDAQLDVNHVAFAQLRVRGGEGGVGTLASECTGALRGTWHAERQLRLGALATRRRTGGRDPRA